MSEEKTPIRVPDMCQKHQRLLLDQVGIGEAGPWRVYVIVAQITLFQGTTAHPDTYHRIGRDVQRIGELGCLACFRPDTFGEVVQALKDGGIPAAKALGDRLIAEGAAKGGEHAGAGTS